MADSVRDPTGRVPRGRILPATVALATLAYVLVAGPWAREAGLPSAARPLGTNVLLATASLIAVAGASRRTVGRAGWTLLGASLMVFAVTNTGWNIVGSPPLSVFDVGFTGYYALAIVGLVLVLRRRLPQLSLTLAADAVLASVAFGTLLAVFALPSVYDDGGATRLQAAVNLAYPLGDLILLALAAGGMSLTGWRGDRGLHLVGAGCIVWGVADSVYLIGTLDGTPAAWVLDLLWVTASMLVGWAAWAPDPEPQESVRTGWRPLAATALATCIALALIVQTGRSGSGWVGLAAAAVTLGTVTRTLLFALEARSLGHELRVAEARAERDPLTGLFNHRAFHERLAAEVDEAKRAGSDLAVILLDIDHFKTINDTIGHQAGDAVLVEVAQRLLAVSRTGDTVARIGGEEFAWLLPGTDDRDAWLAAEHARAAVAADPLPGVASLTVSGGVTDIRHAATAADLVRLADGALYWAKANGRDVVFRYSADVVTALSAVERVEQLARNQALNAVRMLARAVDAKDPYTRRHSERVADLAVQLATGLGWPPERTIALREAALVHDVGKIGVADQILRKAGRLTEDEFAQMKLHPVLGANMVAEVLTAEQTAWVRGHHERVDGTGYPDRLSGDQVTEGMRILTVADSWDAMTSDRPYRPEMAVAEALRRIREGTGTQFCPRVADMLEVLVDAGALLATPPRTTVPGG